jgi:hypothetical protein
VHHIASLGWRVILKPTPKQKVGLRSAFLDGVNCAVAFESGGDGRVKAAHGRAWLDDNQNWACSAVLCGWERPWLAGQGELGVAASSRVPETVELATSEQRARPPAALGLVRLPVSVRAARQCCCLEPMWPRRKTAESATGCRFYVRLAEHEPCGRSLAARAFPI